MPALGTSPLGGYPASFAPGPSTTGPYFAPTYFAPSYFGGLGSPGTIAPPVTTTNAPDPVETVWSLGFGGATWDGTIAAGFALSLSTVLKNAGLVVTFDSSATLDATVWRGGGEPSLFAPSVAWDADNGGYAGGVVALSIAASQASTLDPGEYRFQVGVTTAGVRSLAFDGIIRVTDTIGAGGTPMTWCSFQDVLDISTQVASLNSRSADKAGYLNLRARATAERARKLVKRYMADFGMCWVRGNTFDPILRTLDFKSPTAVYPSKQDITTAIAGGGVVVEQQLRDIVAHDTAATILKRQVGNAQYQAAALDHEAESDRLWKCYQAQIDLPVAGVYDGIPDVLIDTNAILLPPGTAP